MCTNCGCPASGQQHHDHSHSHSHSHEHGHSHGRDHHHHGTLEENPHLSSAKTLEVMSSLLDQNNRYAMVNRKRFDQHGITAINLMGSPGSGKTSLLEATGTFPQIRLGVIEGDLETSQDAQRLQAIGVPAYQITTGTACHLDAHMVGHGMDHIPLHELDYVVVENVGNLVCPANFELGTHANVVLLSVPEGHDKITKYPVIYRYADIIIITKVDLLPHFDFSLDRVRHDLSHINPGATLLTLSTKDPQSLQNWLATLQNLRQKEG